MNPQNQASGTPPTVPMKRKRGRPRKDESAVQGNNRPVIPNADNVLNSNKVAGSTNDRDDQMVGQVVTGVIEGAFSSGYLLNVKVADTDSHLRGLVFLPGQVVPVTAENDVAPHVKMIQRKDIPIPVLNPQTAMHGSVPSSAKCSKQPSEPELLVPNTAHQVLPTEIHSGSSDPNEIQSASAILPVADLTKNETSVSGGVIPQGILEPGNEKIHSASILSELDCDKTVSQPDETLHEPDASTQVKESSADGGAAQDLEPAFQPTNQVQTIENTDKELETGKQAVPPVHKLNELIHDGTNKSIIELNQIPVSAESKSMPSEQVNKSVDSLVEKQASPETNVLEDTKIKLATKTLSKVDTSDSNGKPGTGFGNSLEVGSNHAFETSQPQSIPSEQISKSVPCQSMFSTEGCALQEKSDPQSCGSLDAISKVDANQAIEPLTNPVESENQI